MMKTAAFKFRWIPRRIACNYGMGHGHRWHWGFWWVT
jgi:hypothetical protein